MNGAKAPYIMVLTSELPLALYQSAVKSLKLLLIGIKLRTVPSKLAFVSKIITPVLMN